MEILNITELHPNYGSCKSFYGKAHILDCGDKFVLRSYETNVAYVDKENKTLHRLWDDWSATTGRHVDEFSHQFAHHWCGKKDWDQMEVEAI